MKEIEKYEIILRLEKSHKQSDFYLRIDKFNFKINNQLFPVGHVLYREVFNKTDLLVENIIERIKSLEDDNVPFLKSHYSFLCNGDVQGYLVQFLNDKFPFVSKKEPINRLEFLLKLRVFLFLLDNTENEFNVLNRNNVPVNFNIEFLYACEGNCLRYDESKRIYSETEFTGTKENFELCFFYNVKFKEGKDELIKLTVWTQEKMQDWFNEISIEKKDGLHIFPPFLIVKELNWQKIQEHFLSIIRSEKINQAGSKQEVMLHLARFSQINDLSYWLNEEMDESHLNDDFIEIAGLKTEIG